MYAKLVNGELIPAPTNYRGIINYNRYPEKMVEDGYKPVEYTDMPDDGKDKYDDETLEVIEKAKKTYESQYQEKNDKIVQVWKEINE